MTSEEIQRLREQKYNATLVSIREANPELRIFRVRPDYPLPDHKPGQYGTLGLGNWEPRAPNCQPENLADAHKQQLIRRAYSISSSVLDEQGQLYVAPHRDWLEFYIVLVRETGRPQAPALTPRLFMLQEGDRLFLGEKIAGHYTTAPIQPEDTVLFLSTGTGEAPHNYMLWELLCREHRGPILSACCVRYRRDLAYTDIHETLMQRYPNYTYLPLTTRENPSQKKVYIQDLLSSGELEEQVGKPLDPAHTHVYLCGNPDMIGVPQVDRKTGVKSYPAKRGVVQVLEERGFHIDQPYAKIQGNIHFEEYW